jgi:hypothetical protein
MSSLQISSVFSFSGISLRNNPLLFILFLLTFFYIHVNY